MIATKPPKPDIRERLGARRKAVDLEAIELVKTRELQPGSLLPLVVEPISADVDLVDWAAGARDFIDRHLLRHGAILFRGFGVRSVVSFEAFGRAVTDQLYGEYGDLPQGEGEKVYESTPYPPEKAILYHNEASHTPRWPMKQMFLCVIAARKGGETPIVDCREIYRELRPELREEFARKGLRYVRTFTPGLDVSWQDFFKTTNRAALEERCRRDDVHFEWLPDDGLRTWEICPAVAKHPKTGDDLFFNQIQVHHAAFLDPELRRSMVSVFGEDRLPRSVSYGDGSPIPDEVALETLELYVTNSVAFAWQEGDILLLDNMLTAHSRNPFEGPRKIVVAMGDMLNRADL